MKFLPIVLLTTVSTISFAETPFEETTTPDSNIFLLDNEYTSLEINGSIRTYEGVPNLEWGYQILGSYAITPNIYAMGSFEKTKISNDDLEIVIKGTILKYGIGGHKVFRIEQDEIDVFGYFNLMNLSASISDEDDLIEGSNTGYEVGGGYNIKPGLKPEYVLGLTLFMNRYKDVTFELSDIAYSTFFGYDINPNVQIKMTAGMSFGFDDPKFGLGIKGKL